MVSMGGWSLRSRSGDSDGRHGPGSLPTMETACYPGDETGPLLPEL